MTAGVAIGQLVCCPPCGKERKLSRVYPRTTQGDPSDPGEYYYDETGVYHGHAGWRTTLYECSNGHLWTLRRREKCKSCSFGGETIFDLHEHQPGQRALFTDPNGGRCDGSDERGAFTRFTTMCRCGAVAIGDSYRDGKEIEWRWLGRALPAGGGAA